MRGATRAAALARRLAAAPLDPPQVQPLGALHHLQRGLTGGPSAGAGRAGREGAASWLAAVAAGLGAGVGVQLWAAGSGPAECKAPAADKAGAAGAGKEGKVYDKEEVAKHRTKETGGCRVPLVVVGATTGGRRRRAGKSRC